MDIIAVDADNLEQVRLVAKMYVDAGWSDRGDEDGTRRALKNTYCAFAAFEGGKFAGFFRALSDGVSDAYLLDLFVDPEYRGRGIGGELAARIIAKLKGDGIEWITAISTPEAKNLYLRIGKRMKAHVPIRFL